MCQIWKNQTVHHVPWMLSKIYEGETVQYRWLCGSVPMLQNQWNIYGLHSSFTEHFRGNDQNIKGSKGKIKVYDIAI